MFTYLNAAYVVICWNLIFKSELFCIFILCCCWLCRFADLTVKETFLGKGNWRNSAVVGKYTRSTNIFVFLNMLMHWVIFICFVERFEKYISNKFALFTSNYDMVCAVAEVVRGLTFYQRTMGSILGDSILDLL